MSLGLTQVEGHDPYFFSQRRNHPFQRRLRKTFDDFSLFGERRETLLTFKGGGDAESVVGGGRRPTSAAIRPGTAARRLSTAVSVILPAIDPNGPNLVGGPDPLDALETKSTRSEKKFEPTADHEEREEQNNQLPKKHFHVEEAKFASSSILSNLSKFLYSISEEFSVSLPVELVNALLQSYQRLCEDAVVERREWQTDCYLDYQTKNLRPFLTSAPEDREERVKLEVPMQRILGEKDKVSKQVRMSREVVHSSRVSQQQQPERPPTARSVMSSYSFKSDASRPSSAGESHFEYDMLPAELRPSILHYKRESMAPKVTKRGPKTRLEKKLQSQPKKPKPKKIVLSKTKKSSEEKAEPLEEKGEREVEEEAPATGLAPKQGLTTINFTMTSGDCRDRGWVVTPSDAEDPEANTLLMWEKRHKKREEARLVAKQRGEDGPLVVKFYNDPQIRNLRLKHQRSATYPLSSVLGKLPPSVAASFSTHATNEALLIGEPLTVFVLVLPDGSGYCNYHSGRKAVSLSRRGDGSRGLYTAVFDDTADHTMLGYFFPGGNSCCYYRNGGIRMLTDKEGGTLFDEGGVAERKWVWPPPSGKLAPSVSFQLNAHLSFQCSSQTNIVLRFSCRGQMHRFELGAVLDTAERKAVDPSKEKLQTTLEFSSKAAKDHGGSVQVVSLRRMASHSSYGTRPPSPVKKPLPQKGEAQSSVPGREESTLFLQNERFTRDLSVYRGTIRTVVNHWMEHYRRTIGISLPSHLLTSGPPSASASRSRLVSGRQVRTSMSYGGHSPSRPSTRGTHARYLTHPLPSRTSPSPTLLESRGASRGGSPVATQLLVLEEAGSRALSPIALRPISPLDYAQRPPTTDPPKPFKAGVSKPRKKPERMKCGCPVALHSLLLQGVEEMPSCRCDKRRLPYIADLEFDVFLQSHVPREQLIIVCVVSSVAESSSSCEPMLNSIHYALNRVRFSPCTQCAADAFRLVKYDVCRALRDLRSPLPLLVERHNATPGMFLMYYGGRLVHADYMFNGYGTTRGDFLKQVERCINDGKRGRFLPSDYKFTRRTGGKVHVQNTWAYPVSGVLQDLVLGSPVSSSGTSSVAGMESSRMHSRSVSPTEESKATDFIAVSTVDDLQHSGYSTPQSASCSRSNLLPTASVGLRES